MIFLGSIVLYCKHKHIINNCKWKNIYVVKQCMSTHLTWLEFPNSSNIT